MSLLIEIKQLKHRDSLFQQMRKIDLLSYSLLQMSSNQRFEILSLFVRNVLTSNSKNFQLHGDKQLIVQVLPTAPDRAFISNECYDSSLDLGSISYTDIVQRLLRLGFQIESSSSGSFNLPKPNQRNDGPPITPQETFVLQYTLVRTQSVG